MKTKMTERERQILTCAANILINMSNQLWHEFVTDKKANGLCKYHSKVHKAYNKADRATDDITYILHNIDNK